MTVPVLVISGFLGAGKTTFINRLLARSEGRRISAIVNDFGAINIDAELIADAAETVVGLKNGCICCSLQGDLLRTLKLVLSQPVKPDHIVVEASGVADPRGIVEALMDPILWDATRLDAVVTVIDADDIAATPERRQDELWRAQLAAADFVALSKSQLSSEATVQAAVLRTKLAAKALVFNADDDLPIEALFVADRPQPELDVASIAASRFISVEWQSTGAMHLDRFQAAMGELASQLIRAKGIVNFVEQPGRSFLLQMVGRRASLQPFQRHEPECRLVLIGEAAVFDAEAAYSLLSDMFEAAK